MENQPTNEIKKPERKSIVPVIIIIAILIIAAVACFYLLSGQNSSKITELESQLNQINSQKQDLQSQIEVLNDALKNEKMSKSGFVLKNGFCMPDECFFYERGTNYDENLGIAKLKGYYQQVRREAWGDSELCDDFVVTGGTEELVKGFIDMVDQGNAVNSKNELNQPVINLDLSVLNSAEKEKVIKSTKNSPIELIVLSPSQPGREAPACYSFVKILDVK